MDNIMEFGEVFSIKSEENVDNFVEEMSSDHEEPQLCAIIEMGLPTGAKPDDQEVSLEETCFKKPSGMPPRITRSKKGQMPTPSTPTQTFSSSPIKSNGPAEDNLVTESIIDETEDPTDNEEALIMEIVPIKSKDGKQVTYSVLVAEMPDKKVTANSFQKTFADCLKVIRDVGSKWSLAHRPQGSEEAIHDDDDHDQLIAAGNCKSIHNRTESDISGATEQAPPSNNLDNLEEQLSKNPAAELIHCEKCDRGFSTRSLYDYHASRNRKCCPFCQDWFCTILLLKLHHRQVHNGTDSELENALAAKKASQIFSCEVCGKDFSNKSKLCYHMSIHSENGPYKCDKCPKTFQHRNSFREHTIRHSNQRNHICSLCHKAFKFGKDLNQHLMLHRGIRRFKCRFCEMTFHKTKLRGQHEERMHSVDAAALPSSSSNSKRPTKVTPQPPKHSCKLCGKHFKLEAKLESHLTTVHKGSNDDGEEGGNYQCSICKKKFNDTDGLQSHRTCDKKLKPFKCQICTKLIYRRDLVYVHMQLHKRQGDERGPL